MQKSMVSVVMPAYNAQEYIEEAIDSVLKQTYSELELIIVDDGSTDNTLNIIKRINDHRVRVFENKKNMGIAYSTNRAIDNSQGEYIALMDDDDISLPGRLEKEVDFLEKNVDIDIVGGSAEIIDKYGNSMSLSYNPRYNPKYIKAMLLFRYLNFLNGTAMIRKRLFTINNLRYRDGYYGMQDYQFYIEASKVGKISSIHDVVLKRRIHDKNETDLQFAKNRELRSEKYSDMRIKSLEMSGFKLNESQKRILDIAFPEKNITILSNEELQELFVLFKDILDQAHMMQVDYIEELNFVLKKLYIEKLYLTDIFKTEAN